MEWTIEVIANLCKEYCKRCGVEFDSPVQINASLTRTLGRCTSYCKNGIWNPNLLEFSRLLLETATDNCIKNVIMHECAHYACTKKTHEHHGHDYVFKRYCAIIGTTNDGTHYFGLERKPEVKMESIYRYTMYCSECGNFLGGFTRKSKTVKEIRLYHSNCCHASIQMNKNW